VIDGDYTKKVLKLFFGGGGEELEFNYLRTFVRAHVRFGIPTE
jgi:hypothetical protein